MAGFDAAMSREKSVPYAIAAGCDGLIIEVHNDPEHAWSDGQQCLKYDTFEELINKGKKIAKVIVRDIVTCQK